MSDLVALFLSIVGAAQADYQKWSDALDKQNYRPTFVSVAYIDGNPQFSAIAVPNVPRRPWATRYNITAEQLERELPQHRDKGYRPICISGYRRGNAVNYAVVYSKDAVKNWEARWGQTLEQARTDFDKLTKNGYRPAQFVGYPGPNGSLFASIYVKSDGRDWTARIHVDVAKFHDVIEEFGKKNARPISVSAYPTSDGTRFNVILADNVEKVAWNERHGLSRQQYQQYLDEMTKKGFTPTCVYAYPENGQVHYLAVFEKQER